MSLGVAILACKRPVELEHSLQSYQDNGLFDVVDEVYLHFNGRVEETDEVMNNWPDLLWGGNKVNYGIGWGMIKAIEGLETDNVLFLEEDFYLSKSKEETKDQIEIGLLAIEDGFDMVKYREVEENIVSKILKLLETKGKDLQYGNENVTQLDHALQCAELAE